MIALITLVALGVIVIGIGFIVLLSTALEESMFLSLVIILLGCSILINGILLQPNMMEDKLIRECEANLPRNQHCEINIEAVVGEPK